MLLEIILILLSALGFSLLYDLCYSYKKLEEIKKVVDKREIELNIIKKNIYE